MEQRNLRIGLTALALFAAGSAPLARAADAKKSKEPAEESEVKIPFKEVPAGARHTLRREAMGATITTVDKEKLDGKTVYEADVMIEDENYEIIVGKDGALLSKKLDPESDGDAKAEEKTKKPAKSDEAEDDDEKPAKKEKKAAKSEGDEKSMKKPAKAEDKEEAEDDEKPAKKEKKAAKSEVDEKVMKKAAKSADKEDADDEHDEKPAKSAKKGGAKHEEN